MTEPVVLQAITTLGVVVVAWLGNRKLNGIRDDTTVAREQIENDHANAEFPNLRDELTATREDVRAMRNEIRGLHAEDATLDDTMTRQEIRTQRQIDRATALSDQQIDRLREEVPVMIRREVPAFIAIALSHHVGDCPLRNPQIGG